MVKEMLLIIWQTIIAIFSSIFTIAKNLFSQIPFSKFDFFTKIIEDEFTLTKIKWLDNSLLTIAGIIPPIIIFMFTKIFIKLDTKISALISFLIYVLTIFLFGSKLFWFLLISFFIIVISSVIYIIINKNKKLSKIYVKNDQEIKKIISTESNIRTADQQVNVEMCPVCKSYLTKRNGKYGLFLGCSNFPRCTYTISIN